ncbi:MAG: glycosyl hydrolase family 17 protein [Candidatus Pacebacteria bacterium]|nr:glycosyl hydrolase family 17 protein [Candidatus Paceibacterota bacterium]
MAKPKKLDAICFSYGQEPHLVGPALRDVAKDARVIRTYSPEPYADLARRLGLDIVPGAWLDQYLIENEKRIEALMLAANKQKPRMIVVGNETLWRRDLTPKQLIEYIRRVKAAVPRSIRVTTGEVADRLLEHPEVMRACDCVGMHHYPFWNGVHIDQSLDSFKRMYERLERISHKLVVVLETGWPTGGGSKGAAVASVTNARTYFQQVMRWSQEKGVTVFWFEAFDEAWKLETEGPPGPHWGLRTKPGARRKYWF